MTNVSLRHSVSGVTTEFTEDYANSLLNDPHYGNLLERVYGEEPVAEPEAPVVIEEPAKSATTPKTVSATKGDATVNRKTED